MPEQYNHNLPIDAYRQALMDELNTPPMSNEHKAAIVEELERLGKRTAVENRSTVETTGGANTVGRAPSHAAEQTVGVEPDNGR